MVNPKEAALPSQPEALDGERRALFDGLAKGNWHRPGGIKTLRLRRVDEEFFDRIRSEVMEIIRENDPVAGTEIKGFSDKVHPIGKATRFTLFNRTGDFKDTKDHRSLRGKRFHHAERFPALGEFITSFPGLLMMRIQSLYPSAALSAHAVNVVHSSETGHWVRCRFHLAIVTNPKAEIMLDGQHYHYEPGIIYFFNNGCVHSAANGGDEVRWHLVWDMALTEENYEVMFSDAEPNARFLKRIPRAERDLMPIRSSAIGAYRTSGLGAAMHKRLRLGALGLKPHQFQKLYDRFDYARFRLTGGLSFARLESIQREDGREHT